jgi:GxxExxY protein
MNPDDAHLNRLSERIIGCAFTVANALGSGFLEKIYETALAHELRKAGPRVVQQRGIVVMYDGIVVGEYAADPLVEEVVLVELKAIKALDEVHSARCINHLKGTGLRLCLLIDFGKPRIEVKRLVPGP